MSKLIHFVCKGNTYRSRLAEAYFNSVDTPNLECISSGVEAHAIEDPPIEWYSMKIIQNNNLVLGMSRDSKKTSKEMIENADFTVFMEKEIYEFCKNMLGFNSDLYQIWNIEDLHTRDKSVEEIITISESAFKNISEKVDSLVKDLAI